MHPTSLRRGWSVPWCVGLSSAYVGKVRGWRYLVGYQVGHLVVDFIFSYFVAFSENIWR